MTYDYHGHWDKKTGHVAPFYSHPDDEFSFFNANFTMNYWVEKGADKKKLVMGMPMYGQSFSLADKTRQAAYKSKCLIQNQVTDVYFAALMPNLEAT
jgi:GH18 family chitinase